MLMLAAFAVSCLCTFLLVQYSWLHLGLTGDHASGPQKFHVHEVSRVGGLGVISAFAWAIVINWLYPGKLIPDGALVVGNQILLLLGCSFIAFAGGFAEDIKKSLSVRTRLFATFLAAALAFLILDGRLDRVGVAGLDSVLEIKVAALLFTMIAVGGIANAVNIVDGYNGLSGVVVLFAFAAMAYVASLVGDAFIFEVCIVLMGAVLGFLVWNFPHGKIFLGDGGAYFLGFMIAELSVLLVRRHPEVSPWFPLMLVAYPVWETFFSIYRKKLVRGQSAGQPDGMHFHMMVHKRVVRWKVGSKDPRDRIVRNALTSPYLWAVSLLTIIPGLMFWDNTLVLAFCFFGFAMLYNWLYNRMASFRVPKWLIIRSPKSLAIEQTRGIELSDS